MVSIIYGNSTTGLVDTEYAVSVQLTYHDLLRDDADNELAEYKADCWVRHDGTEWTDISFEASTL